MKKRTLYKKDKCDECGKDISKERKWRSSRFCSRNCSFKWRKDKKYQDYLNNNSIIWGQQNLRIYKTRFLEEQNHKCAICGMKDEWNNKPIVFIIDHINGDANDNTRSNLRIICPNCDSQLETFKFKNSKKSSRSFFRKTVHIKELYLRNKMNGRDDIGETLTDNTDGNAEGMDKTSP